MLQTSAKPGEISDVLLQQLRGIDISARYDEIGKVLQVSDGVARVYGLESAEAGELLDFECGVTDSGRSGATSWRCLLSARLPESFSASPCASLCRPASRASIR